MKSALNAALLGQPGPYALDQLTLSDLQRLATLLIFHIADKAGQISDSRNLFNDGPKALVSFGFDITEVMLIWWYIRKKMEKLPKSDWERIAQEQLSLIAFLRRRGNGKFWNLSNEEIKQLIFTQVQQGAFPLPSLAANDNAVQTAREAEI